MFVLAQKRVHLLNKSLLAPKNVCICPKMSVLAPKLVHLPNNAFTCPKMSVLAQECVYLPKNVCTLQRKAFGDGCNFLALKFDDKKLREIDCNLLETFVLIKLLRTLSS